MFGLNKDKDPNSNSPSNAVGHNIVVQGTTIKGKVTSAANIRIDGVLEGDLKCDAKVIIGPKGYVKGDVVCKNALVEGKVDGNIKVFERLDLRSTSLIEGDIVSIKLVVENGAIFNGACRMGKQAFDNFGKEENEKNASKPKNSSNKKVRVS